MAKHTIGLEKEIINETTGSPATFHLVDSIYLTRSGDAAQVNIISYFNREAYDSGKYPIGSFSTAVVGEPRRGTDVYDWVYQSLAEDSNSVLHGAVLLQEK